MEVLLHPRQRKLLAWCLGRSLRDPRRILEGPIAQEKDGLLVEALLREIRERDSLRHRIEEADYVSVGRGLHGKRLKTLEAFVRRVANLGKDGEVRPGVMAENLDEAEESLMENDEALGLLHDLISSARGLSPLEDRSEDQPGKGSS